MKIILGTVIMASAIIGAMADAAPPVPKPNPLRCQTVEDIVQDIRDYPRDVVTFIVVNERTGCAKKSAPIPLDTSAR